MSTPELMKSPLPLNAAQSENSNNAGSSGSPLKSGSTAGTPLRSKAAPPIGGNAASNNENTAQKGKQLPKVPEEFYKDLQQFHEKRGTPVVHFPKINGKLIDLHKLYSEVTERGGFAKVNNRDEWDEILSEVGFKKKCVNASAAIKQVYRRFLDKYERLNFFGEDPDKLDASDVSDSNDGSRLRRFFPSLLGACGLNVNTVPMTYNYRQHVVNMERRRIHKLSLDLHKPSPYEKLLLSLMAPLPNEQDFAINVCTLMANESKHTLKINECPKLLDALLAHAGVFSDISLRELFQYVYKEVRHHSLLAFWQDLLHNKTQILDLYNHEQAARDSLSITQGELEFIKPKPKHKECLDMDFLNLGRGKGTQEYVGQRVQQILAILRNLSFFDENVQVFAKNRSLIRFLIMCANVRWGNIHNQALDIAGNVATELELLDPTSDDLSRSLMATLCDGVEGMDRAVIINSLEIMYKLCQRESNGDHIFKCLSLNFYQTVCMFLSLNDIMLLIYTLEAIYALSSLGARFCHIIMQVRGIIDQLVSLITVEAQSYGPDGCILMRVVETVPGNMLPIVAQNIANLQTVAVLQNKPTTVGPTAAQSQPPQDTPHQQQPVGTTESPPLGSPQQSTALQCNVASQEDEQYALAWLGATFDRANSVECRVEQQELYRMYLSHCQKSGKHSVVTHTQFPRLVRLIFTNSVGPIAVRRSDGTELPGMYYVTIRLRAQPLPIQGKTTASVQKSSDGSSSLRKLKKKPKLQLEQQQSQASTPAPVVKPETIETSNTMAVKTNNPVQTQEMAVPNPTLPNLSESTTKCTPADESPPPNDSAGTVSASTSTVEKVFPMVEASTADTTITPTASSASGQTESGTTISQSTTPQISTTPQPSSSLIKSLLANKVTQRQQKQKEMVAAASATVTAAQSSPIKVASASISALVNNPLMQNTPLKVGQTTIKPLNAQIGVEKKHANESTPPPLAPLSGGNTTTNDNGRPVILSNQVLVDRLDKKTADTAAMCSFAAKRKLDEASSTVGRDNAKRPAVESIKITETQVTPSKNAANLYAEMAASILEDEELEDIPPAVTPIINQQDHQKQQVMIPATIQAAGAPLQNVPRQLVFQTNQAPHMKLAQPSQQQVPTAMATIKTEQGLQTVPVILQSKPMEHQQQQIIQQVIQAKVPVSVPPSQPQTQYVLATNPQGQTYLVAQQSQPSTHPAQPTQTVLVTQTPQQHSAGTKTIIILQQQTSQPPQQQIITSGPVGTQKMIMTTAQGQQVFVTQRQPATITSQPQQFFINPQTGAATHIQHVPVGSVPPNLQQANATIMPRQLIQQPALCSNSQQSQTGHISPSLLSQLNHIPATIKLHNPNIQMTTTSNVLSQQQLGSVALSRLPKSVSIIQATSPALTTASPMQIPQLQQHQSIIQQHIISGPCEKRQVLVGGRAIEIKETVITQTPPPPPPQQQSQLNSQTIITTQPPFQQQKMSSATQQQQSQSFIQQKISFPMQNQQSVSKEPVPSLIQSCIKYMPQPQAQQVGVANVKKQQATVLTKQQQQPQVMQAQNAVKNQVVNSRPATPMSIAACSEFGATVDNMRSNVEIKNNAESQPYSTQVKPTISPLTISTTTSTPTPQLQPIQIQPTIDPNWLYICDWRNCPRRKFKSVQDLHHHACLVHCPDHLEPGAEIFCQWGPGPGLCDGIPRKRFSLMTHILDRHLTTESLRSAVQRRIQTGVNNIPQPSQSPVTIVRNIEAAQRGNTASPALSTSSSGSLPSTGSSAIHAIKRHTADFVNPKELMDENEGPVTKSIRLTASLVLRNLVMYSTNAKRSLRRHEAHLANVALSNVESSGTISHILFEISN